jgi:predicted Zn-dependent protease
VQRGSDVARVRSIGQRLVPYCGRTDLPYQFNVLNTDDVNALAVPGGHVYVTRGLLDQARPDDHELAGVIGHEIAHVSRRHSAKMIEKSSKTSVLVAILTHQSGEDAQAVAQLAQNLYLQSYSREEESEADWHGIGYAYQAGYDPRGLKRFFEELHRLQGGKEPRGVEVYLSSHPQTTDRIRQAEKRAAELEQSGR